MSRTLAKQEHDDMTTRTLTREEQARLNYLCFIEWGETLDGMRQMVTIARRLRRSNHRSYVKRTNKRKQANAPHEFQVVEAPAMMMPLVDYTGTSSSSLGSSLDSGSPDSVRAAAERVRNVMTPPDSPPKISYSLKSTPTPSPVTWGLDTEVLPTGTHSSDYIRCKE